MSLFHKKLLKFYNLCHFFFAFFRCIKRHISVFFTRKYRIKCYILNFLFKKRIVWLIGSEDFGNIGDHLIAKATILFLKETCKNKIILEIPLSDYYDFFPIISKKINKKSLIILSGGGNFGTLYPYAMNAKREICSNLANKIIIFPQSVFYENNKEVIYKDKKIFSKRNIYLFLRDQISYNFCKQNISNNSFLCSDITLSIENILIKTGKKVKFDVLLCLRHDKERITDDFFINSVKNELRKMKMSFTEFDTQLSNDFSMYSRNKKIKKAFKTFNECSYVITDRLHGCIISLMCKKPIIVIDNSYKKISGFLDTLEIEDGVWLANLNSFPKILNIFNKKPNPPKYKIKQNFDKLRKILLDK